MDDAGDSRAEGIIVVQENKKRLYWWLQPKIPLGLGM